MRITESRLRKIIRDVIKENASDQKKAFKCFPHTAEVELSRDVEHLTFSIKYTFGEGGRIFESESNYMSSMFVDGFDDYIGNQGRPYRTTKHAIEYIFNTFSKSIVDRIILDVPEVDESEVWACITSDENKKQILEGLLYNLDSSYRHSFKIFFEFIEEQLELRRSEREYY
jgi:hypothetical protein